MGIYAHVNTLQFKNTRGCKYALHCIGVRLLSEGGRTFLLCFSTSILVMDAEL